MPIKWTPELDQLLLCLIIETQTFKLDPEKVVAAWPTDKGDVPTARAITERIVRIRQRGKTHGKPNGKKSRFSLSFSASKSTNATPRKLGDPAPVTPKKPLSSAKSTPAGRKRKVVKKLSDDDDSDDLYIKVPTRVARHKAEEPVDGPTAGHESQTVDFMDTGSSPKMAGTLKRQAADHDLGTMYHGLRHDQATDDLQQSRSYEELDDAFMMSGPNTNEEVPSIHHRPASHGIVYDHPDIGARSTELENWVNYQAFCARVGGHSDTENSYEDNFGVVYGENTGYGRDIVYDNHVSYEDSSMYDTPVLLRRQPPQPTAFSAAYNMPPSQETDGEKSVDDVSEESRGSPPPRPRTRRAVSRHAALQQEREELYGTEEESAGESIYSEYTDGGEII
ncbi:hypothetical protein AOQ84DRAFT_421325 [Glonium stellatum]|uniref:Uncharacterized protein n=1 Tax=Glonium stellatum TaxID=574774 RepID=A0A8E2F7V8_9PEZI|nr:hypothetical protein AOQ84DRAFT_421325 [Glonium stellatum]